MATVNIIFPHQLFKTCPLPKANETFLVEEDLFFNQFQFHKQKLVFHRATMKMYAQHLTQSKYQVTYIEAQSKQSKIKQLIADLKKDAIETIAVIDVVDNWLNKHLQEACKKADIKINCVPTPAFINELKIGQDFFKGKKKFFQTDFYVAQRKQHQILLTATGEPIGGKWTFDVDNRKKVPANHVLPKIAAAKHNEFVTEAIAYVEKHFTKNYGDLNSFIYPTDFKQAESWLQDFLKQRFAGFGDYEDAMVLNENFLHHSVLSPLINVGLLLPMQVIEAATNYAAKNNISLNSSEGFVRQILGWREFIRVVYECAGTVQRTKNYWGFDRKIPSSFWKGETGITPVDDAIKKCLATGYNHHIERLMILGNFMLLCEFNPNQVYKWFMEMYIDAYDWVMVPNVYGMVQFADGGLMTTKPYISGSNYILKMSDYKKGDWCAIWDGLFWRFMHVHRSFFLSNPRLGMLVKTFDKMPEQKRNEHLSNAENFLIKLDAKTRPL
jgi:deoxyribodipyrimidine photolyase-related protein